MFKRKKASQLSEQLDWLEDQLEKESKKSKVAKRILESYYMKFWNTLSDRPVKNANKARPAKVARKQNPDLESDHVVGEAFTD